MDELKDCRLAPPGGEGGVELADVVLGPRGLNAGEDVDGPAVDDADLLLHLTEWHHFTTIDPKCLAARTTTPKVIDARGTLNTAQWGEAGWTTRGRGSF
ncbi:hypothetical protein ACFWBC_34475 [Streptomyces sp. NPDC059985]|uniref:hypothetical protein n=1 Tax=Streptomyces sp. NPDC059985 TaxID=3347025 RepID=UPI003674D8B2